MTDIAAEMRKAAELRGDTYSSMEIWGLLGRGAAEIDRLTTAVNMLLDGTAMRDAEIERLYEATQIQGAEIKRICDLWMADKARLKAAMETSS